MISWIFNVVNVVRHYFVMERYFPDTNLRDMRPHLVQYDIYSISMTSKDILFSRTILRGRYEHSLGGWASTCDPQLYECNNVQSKY